MLFVCTANVCRSPMAEAVFKALTEDRGAPWEAASAGVKALVGQPISPRARATLHEIGVFPDGHRSRQVDAVMLEEADLVLTMTHDHTEILRRLSAPASGKIHTLGAYAEGTTEGGNIPDPHGQSLAAHRASLRQLLRYLEALVGRMENDRKLCG